MRGDTLGGGGGCNGSPPGVIDSAGTGDVGAGGGVRGRAARGFYNVTERAVREWNEGSWIGVISDVRTLTPGRRGHPCRNRRRSPARGDASSRMRLNWCV